ncbi:uncharacterized protein LOC132545513 [Ylistrum balloti]|uniref:uncharacterized protein LOC132545513 n=1 Tax=Ylistrum balloti TaxID=509963 RepID=UPI002905EBB6|nr:uncharacterized protein LOC132545513 [Ylistrum balloti]
MPRNKRLSPTKHVQKESRSKSTGKDNQDKIFQSVQEMFAGQLEAEIIHMVLEECDWNVEKAVDNLFAISETGIKTDPENKNRLAQIAHDILCSDVSSDSMSVSSHSSMASTEETSSSRSGLTKSSSNNSREIILNSTEIEGATSFDPTMIEVEHFVKPMPVESENIDILNQYCADADAWVSSVNNIGVTAVDKGYKNFDRQSLQNNIVADVSPVSKTSPVIMEADVSWPQLNSQDHTSDADGPQSQHSSSVSVIMRELNVMLPSKTHVKSKSSSYSDYIHEEGEDIIKRHSDSANVDIVGHMPCRAPCKSMTSCDMNRDSEGLVNTGNISSNLTPDSSTSLKDMFQSSGSIDGSIPSLTTDIMQGTQISGSEQDILGFSSALIPPEDMEYNSNENLDDSGKKVQSLTSKGSLSRVLMEPESPVSVFENLGKLAGEIAHMELQPQVQSHSSLEIFNSDDFDNEFLYGTKSDLQNSGRLINFQTDVYKDDDKLNFKSSENLVNIDKDHSVVSKNRPNLQTFDLDFSRSDGNTTYQTANSGNGETDQYTNILEKIEASNSESNVKNLMLDLDKDMDELSSEQMYDSDNISNSSSDSLNESLTRALDDSINLTDLGVVTNENDNYDGVVRSQSCMGSQSEDELGDELTTALNKSVDLTSPGIQNDNGSSQVESSENVTTTSKILLTLHDSDSDEKLSKFSEKIRKDELEKNAPVQGKESQTRTRTRDSVGLPNFPSNLSVNACEFVPNIATEVQALNMNKSSNPNKPKFLTPKYVSAPQPISRYKFPIDGKLQQPFSSGTQQTVSENSLPEKAWSTPFRPHNSTAVGNNTWRSCSNMGYPPPKIPEHPPPYWLSPAPLVKQAEIITQKETPSSTKLTDIQKVEIKIQAGHKCFVMLRGLPGSGKSTLARKLQRASVRPGVVLSSDDYFVQDGVYKFEPHLLSEAHEWNRLRTIQNLHKGCTPIIVDNTNTQAWEMKPYVKQAQKFGYDVCFLEPDTPWKFQAKELARKNTHGVPLHKIRIMLERYEKGLTVEHVLGKPPKQSDEAKKIISDQKTHHKEKTMHTDGVTQPGWRHSQSSLVQQYANSLGKGQKQHAQQPKSKHTLNSPTKRNEKVMEDIFSESPGVFLLSSVVSSVSDCNQTQQSPTVVPHTDLNPLSLPSCSNENNNNISQADWKMCEQSRQSDSVRQFSRSDHKNVAVDSSTAGMTSMDMDRGLPLDKQLVETPAAVENMGQQTESLEIIPNKDLAVISPRELHDTTPVESELEDTGNSSSPRSHKGSMAGNMKNMSPRSQSSGVRDSSSSSEGTFHTCCEMLTDQEEVISSVQEDQAIDSQETSIDLSNLSSLEEGADSIIESNNISEVEHGPVIPDRASEPDDCSDCPVVSDKKPGFIQHHATSGGHCIQNTEEENKDAQKTDDQDIEIQKLYIDENDTQNKPEDHPDSQKMPGDSANMQKTSKNDDTHQISEDDHISSQSTVDVLDSQQTLVENLDTEQITEDHLNPKQTMSDELDTHQTLVSGTLVIVDGLTTKDEMVASNDEILTDKFAMEENIDVKQKVGSPEVMIDQHNINTLEDSKVRKGIETGTKYSSEDIPQNVKDTVDELIRDNVGSDLNYSIDFSVTANELKAILLFTDLDEDEKVVAEQYISYRLCGNRSEAYSTTTSQQKILDEETANSSPIIQEDLNEQILNRDFYSAQILDWEEPKPARKQRISKHPKVKNVQELSNLKKDVKKTENESLRIPMEHGLENQKVLKTLSNVEQEDINMWTCPQRQRQKRTRNYRKHATSPPVDDTDQKISTESKIEPLVTSVACQALTKEAEEDCSQSSQSQLSLEPSPTKPAKKKSNRRKLDPYKQGPFLEAEVKEKVIGADWTFPELSESVLKPDIPQKKKVLCLLEHETYITTRDLKVLNAVNRGDDPTHLIGGRKCYHILAAQNKDISGEVSNLEVSSVKCVEAQHCVDRGTMTEENVEADIDFLQNSFPTIPIDELSEVLRQCGNNLQWAINLLLDWKYNIPLSSDDKEKFVSRMFQLQKSPTVPKFSFSAGQRPVVQSPTSLLDICVRYVESQHIAPRQDVEHQIIMSSQQRLHSIEENIRLKRTHSRTFTQSAVPDDEFNENILKELISMTEQASSDSTSDASDDKVVLDNQLDISYVESWTANQANDFTKGPSMESSASGNRSDEEAHDFQALQSSTPVMAIQLSGETIQDLQRQFGPISHLSGVKGDVVVPLDYRTAQALHRCLMLTINQQTVDRQKQMLEDEAFARRLQDEEILKTRNQPPPSFNPPPMNHSLPLGGVNQVQHKQHPKEQGVTSLKDIMVEEMERERRKEEEIKLLEASGNHNVLANRLKRKKLYEQFPGIDETLLDDIYRDNSYNLDNTVLAIRGFLTHDTTPPKNVRTQEASEAYEEKLLAAAKQQSLQEMMDSYMYSPEERKTYQEHEDPDYDDFRAEANIHHRLRHECFQKAQEAYRRGMRDVASFYSRQGHGHSQKIKEANQRAAEKILQRNSLLKERSAIDLHGLHVDEAIEALERIIPEREEDLKANPDKRKQHLVIITGRGSHSRGGIARIRPAVLRFLVANGYKYSEIYKGCFKILLKYR